MYIFAVFSGDFRLSILISHRWPSPQTPDLFCVYICIHSYTHIRIRILFSISFSLSLSLSFSLYIFVHICICMQFSVEISDGHYSLAIDDGWLSLDSVLIEAFVLKMRDMIDWNVWCDSFTRVTWMVSPNICINESCQTHECVTLRAWRRDSFTFVIWRTIDDGWLSLDLVLNESLHIYEWISVHIYGWIIANVWISHCTYTNESSNTHECVTLHTWRRDSFLCLTRMAIDDGWLSLHSVYLQLSHTCKWVIAYYKLIERNPPPRGGVLLTMFPCQEPCVGDVTTRCDGRITTRCDGRISSWNLLHTALDKGT